MSEHSTETDTRFEALADTAPDGIVTIDAQSTILFANAAMQRILGWAPDELVGKRLDVLMPERHRAAHLRGVERYLRTGQRKLNWNGIALSGLHKNGVEIPLEISFGVFVDASGEPTFSGFIRDVSERVQAQQALKEARVRAEQALRELHRINAVVDVAMSQVTYEEMLKQLLQRLREELEADEATVLLLDQERHDLVVQASTMASDITDDKVRVPLGSGIAGRVAATAMPVIIRDTSTTDVVSSRVKSLGSLVAVPVISEAEVIGVLHVGSLAQNHFDPEDIKLLQIVSDRMAGVLARTRLYQQLELLRTESIQREAHERSLRSLAQAITGAVRIPEVMHQIVEGALTVSGAAGAYVEQVQPDRSHVEIVAAAGEHTPAVGARVDYPGSLTEEIIGAGSPVFLPRMQGIGAAMATTLASSCKVCSALAVPVRANEEVLGALVLLQTGDESFREDVVKRVRVLGELASISLLRLVAMAESERRRAEAEQAVRARDEVLSIVSHDLRNPVSTVAMSAALLRDPEITLSTEQRGQQLDVISRSAQRMNRLIQDLLDVARIEGGRFTITCRCEDPATLVSEACESFQPVAKSKNIVLSCHSAVGLPKIFVDRDRILQVLSNYLNNAVKFTPEGGLITVRAEHCDNGEVQFSVRDTGPGIAEEDLPRVFDRFWQARRTKHLGSGLGLAIAAGIAQAHKGRVSASSVLGGGSTFNLILPWAKECAS